MTTTARWTTPVQALLLLAVGGALVHRPVKRVLIGP